MIGPGDEERDEHRQAEGDDDMADERAEREQAWRDRSW